MYHGTKKLGIIHNKYEYFDLMLDEKIQDRDKKNISKHSSCVLSSSGVPGWHWPLWLMEDRVPGVSLSSQQQSPQHCAQQMIINAVVSVSATLKQQHNKPNHSSPNALFREDSHPWREGGWEPKMGCKAFYFFLHNGLKSKCKWGLWHAKECSFFPPPVLTISSKLSAIFSSDPGRRSSLSRPPWMWIARLTPAIATTRARRVTSADVSMALSGRGGRVPRADWDVGRGHTCCSEVLLRIWLLLLRFWWWGPLWTGSSFGLIYASQCPAGGPQETGRMTLIYKGKWATG